MTDRSLKKASYAVLIVPAVLIYASVIIIPIIYSFVLSFTEWTGYGIPKFIGLTNYKNMIIDPRFLHGLRNNILIVFISIFGQIPLGFVLAYIIYRKLVKAVNFFEAMIFLPITISSVVIAILFRHIFSGSGILTQLVRIIRDDSRFIFAAFGDKYFAIIPILFVILWMYTGLYMIIFIANLQRISPSVLEAAVIDGATEGQILTRIVIPSMIGVLFTTFVLAISGSLKSFDLIFAMTAGGPANYTEVIAIYMYQTTFKYYNYGFGSAVSMAIVVLSVGLISIVQKVFGTMEKKYN
jgi:raffinose/stachyose/melibiose transport system permease protein